MTLSISARCQLVAVVVCLDSLSGCSQHDGPVRYKVSGKVTVNGEPAPAFEVFFRPDSAQGNSGPGAMVRGRQGLYETRSGKGVSVGPHLVEIIAFDGIPNSESTDGNALTPKAYITTVTLPAEDSEQNFDVPASALAPK